MGGRPALITLRVLAPGRAALVSCIVHHPSFFPHLQPSFVIQTPIIFIKSTLLGRDSRVVILSTVFTVHLHPTKIVFTTIVLKPYFQKYRYIANHPSYFKSPR